MGNVTVPSIPETEWIEETLNTGREYIQIAFEQKGLMDRLRTLRNEKQSKTAQLAEL